MMYRGKRWRLSSDDRAQEIESLGMSLAGASRDPRFHDEAHGLLRCDYRALWRDVRDVLATMRLPPVAFGRVSFAVASIDEKSWLDARIDMESVASPAEGGAPFKIVLTMVGRPDSVDTTPRLRTDERTLAFAAGSPYSEGASNELANAHWQALLGDLRAAKSKGVVAVDLGVSAHVRWAYVAMTLGMLLEADLRTVRIEGDWYRISTPPRTRVFRTPGDPELSDAAPVLAIGLGAITALGVFALGALTARRRSRQRASVSPMR